MLSSGSRFDLSGTKDGDREIVTRTFKSLRFEPHPRRKILIIRGEVAISVTGVCGQLIDENLQEFKKLVKLEGLTTECNIRRVIDEILEQCPFVPDDLVPQLVGVLDILKVRKYDLHGLAILSADSGNRTAPIFPEYFEDEDVIAYADADMREIKMDSLDLYVELLYEDLQDKVRGARCVWKLSNSSENLVTILTHDTALNAVFRTLREDYRKSIELTTNLLNLILAFARFSDFHPHLITNKICSMTLDIIEFELSRYEKWVDELYRRKELAENEETATAKQKADFDKMRIKFSELTRKQDQLLTVAFDVVKHLAESPSFSQEVKNRGVVRFLMMTLERTNVKLLTVVVSFLLNLSSYKEAVQEMSDFKVVQQTFRLLDQGIPHELLQHVIGLFYNLSFDTKLRFKMVKLGVLTKLAQFYDNVEYRGNCILTMYNISVDHKFRPKFIAADIIPKLMVKILGSADCDYLIETEALLLNLAASKRCSVTICGNNRLIRLVKVAMQRQDPTLVKIIRKISGHPGSTKSLFTELVVKIVAAIRETSSPEFINECLGTLSNLFLPDIDFCELLQGYQLLKVIRTVLNKPVPRIRLHGGDERSIQESMLLEVIIFLGTCGSEPSCADFLVQEGIVDHLCHIGRVPALDTDLRLQLLYAIYRMSSHTKTLKYIIEKTKIPDLIFSFIRSECTEIREISQAVWTVFGEYNEEWQDKVRSERFLAHNEHWLEIIGRAGQITMDRNTINQFQARLNAEKISNQSKYPIKKRIPDKYSSESFDDSESEDSEDEFEDDEDDENEGALPINQLHTQIDGNDESESDQSKGKSIFDQFKHQFNQDMVNRIYGSANSDEDEETAVMDLGENNSRSPRQRSGSTSSRPATAHHSGRSAASMGTTRNITPPNATSRKASSSPVPKYCLSSSSSSFESHNSQAQGISETHPSKRVQTPIIVNIKPKESW